MIEKLKRYFQGGEAASIFRGMATLTMGAGAARLIGIVSIPFLTRIYSPEDYGVLSVYVAMIAILAPCLTLRYIQALPLPRGDGMAMNLMAVSLLLITLSSILLTLLLWLAGPTVLSWISMEVLTPWWWLILLGVIGAALYETLSLWATRKKSYRIIARTQITQSLMGVGLKLALGILAFKPFGLLLGHFVSQSAGIGSFINRFGTDFRTLKRRVNRRRMWFITAHYIGFPIYRLPSQFLMSFSVQAPVIMATALYGVEITGQLGLAIMALTLPINIIGQAISKAFYAEIAAIGKSDLVKIKKIAYIVQIRLFSIGIPIFLILLLFSERVFGLVFGKDWVVAGSFAAALSPYVLLQLTSAPLIQVLNIFNSQRYFLAINIIRTIGLVAVFYTTRYFGLSAENFVLLLSGFLFSFYFLVSAFILYMVRSYSTK
jgi:O-antigen/teichoic acid export membrane protein